MSAGETNVVAVGAGVGGGIAALVVGAGLVLLCLRRQRAAAEVKGVANADAGRA
jgi:hypothetical protein